MTAGAAAAASSADEYTFPYSTCEVPPLTSSKCWWWPDQPWSAAVNMIMLMVVLFFFVLARSWVSRAFIGSLFLFEASHTSAHWVHLPGFTQQWTTHMLAFVVNISLIMLLYRVSGGSWPSAWVWAMWAALVLLDLYVFLWVGSFIWSVLTQVIIFYSIFFVYYSVLPKWVRRLLLVLLLFSGLIYAAVWNEKWNCGKMLDFCPWFPWHVIVEGLSIVPISLLAWMFYRF